MNIFEDLIKIVSDGEIFYNEWIEWNHNSIPNKPDWLRDIIRNLMVLLNHCMICTALDGCYFVVKNMPNQPMHIKCHCNKRIIDYLKVKKYAKAKCDIRKFTEYIFKDAQDSKGKNQIFYKMGFNVEDSYFLQEELCNQALRKYLSGEYILKNLDCRGQRLATPINLNGVEFYSGWLLCPEGEIKNTTPFGGWVK